MDWIARLNQTIDYIEAHLTDSIDYQAIAQIACCSSYHYQRMFAYMADVPLSEYIRRRRMSRAAVDLQNGEKIVDVALKYGYASPTAFNRAFQTVHGLAPSHARDVGVALKTFSPISFTITVKGAEEMQYRIEKRDPIRVVGVSVPLSKIVEENFQTLPQVWGRVQQDGTILKLCAKMNAEPMGVLGVCRTNDVEDWRYYIAVASTAPCDDFEEYTIPAATWAVFSGEGKSTSIQQLEQQITTQWLPNSGYEYGTAADIEVYLNEDMEHAKFEVWIPVVKK